MTASPALHSDVVDTFSLFRGGAVYRFERLLKLVVDRRSAVRSRALLAIAITWLPLLILTILSGTAWGDRVRIPFLFDFSANIRFLVTLPLLILAQVVIDHKTKTAVGGELPNRVKFWEFWRFGRMPRCATSSSFSSI
jgi:hypothetical protein